MGDSFTDEQCVLCGNGAAVRVSGTSFCASCGLERLRGTSAPVAPATSRWRWRAIRTGISASLVAKALVGAMALAATGVVALTPSSSVDPGGPTPESPVALSASPSNDRPLDPVGAALPPDSVIPDATPMIEIATADGHSPRADDSTLSAAQQYAAAVAAWSQCLGTASTQAELSELMQTCGPVPDISGFGVDDDGEVTLAAAEGDDPLGDDEGDDPPGDDEGDDPPGDDEADDPPADDPPADDPPADDPPGGDDDDDDDDD